MPMMAIMAKRPLANSAESFLVLQVNIHSKREHAQSMIKMTKRKARDEQRWQRDDQDMTKRINRPEFRILDRVAEANQAKAKVALSVVAFPTKSYQIQKSGFIPPTQYRTGMELVNCGFHLARRSSCWQPTRGSQRKQASEPSPLLAQRRGPALKQNIVYDKSWRNLIYIYTKICLKIFLQIYLT